MDKRIATPIACIGDYGNFSHASICCRWLLRSTEFAYCCGVGGMLGARALSSAIRTTRTRDLFSGSVNSGRTYGNYTGVHIFPPVLTTVDTAHVNDHATGCICEDQNTSLVSKNIVTLCLLLVGIVNREQRSWRVKKRFT